jgi:hypothetical protein
MRHLGSIILSLVLAPTIYLLVGIGLIKTSTPGIDGRTDPSALAVGFVTMVTAGLLYALLVQSRLSPLGPVLAAVVLLVVQVWVLFAKENFTSTFPKAVFGVEDAAMAPAEVGAALLLAVPLLVTVVSPRRWRRTAQPAAPAPYAAAPPYGYQQYTPSYPPPPPAPFPAAQPPVSAPPGFPPAPPAPSWAYPPQSEAPTTLVQPATPEPAKTAEPEPPTAPVRRPPEPPVDPDRTRML